MAHEPFSLFSLMVRFHIRTVFMFSITLIGSLVLVGMSSEVRYSVVYIDVHRCNSLNADWKDEVGFLVERLVIDTPEYTS
jgi:hypothetical protein